MGCDSMGYRLLVRNRASPYMRFIRGDTATVRQEWRGLGLDSVNDNDPDGQARKERIGASVLGGGPSDAAKLVLRNHRILRSLGIGIS